MNYFLYFYFLCLLICLTSCRKLISTEYKDAQVVLTNAVYKHAFIQVIPIGKTPIVIHHPEKNYIFISYEGQEYSLNGKEYYEKYFEMIGCDLIAVFEVKTYDNGKVTLKCVGVKGEVD